MGTQTVRAPRGGRRRATAWVSSVLLAAAAVGVSAAPALADDQPADVTSAIDNASPSALSDAAVNVHSDADSAVTTTNAGVTVDLPSDPSDSVALSGGASSNALNVTLPHAQSADDAQSVATGAVSYDNNNGSQTVPVAEADGSLRINTVIENAAAPTSYTYGINVPAGGSIVQDSSGALAILDSSGNFVAGVSAPWAKDATGAAVPTHFEVGENQITQVVDLSDSNIVYPVVADPWLWKDTIDHTSWSYAVAGDPRLQVFPTGWGRAWSGPAVWGEQWGEVLSKTRDHKDWANTDEMRWQFDCHLALGANLWKDSYNLDRINHRGSLANYIVHKCN